MNTGKNNRRGFLTTLASAAAGGTLLNSTLGVSSARALDVNPLAERLENEYLLSEGLIYLNTGTLGPCRRATVLATNKAWEELESFPIKFYGKQALDAPEKTRTVAARFFGCNLDEILLTHSTTSGMNMIAQGLRLKVRDRILITNQEHAGGLFCWNYLEKYHGVVIDKVDISHQDSVESILKKLKDNLKKETKVISLSHVFSSTGMRLPVAEISSLARANGVLCVVDGAQAAGAIAVNVKQLGCHAYAAGGHKWLMGPKGTGFLYISKEAQEAVRPMQFEESYNTYSSSNGVVNRAAILGLATAIEYLESIGIEKVEEYNLALRNRLLDKVSQIPNIKIISPKEKSLSSPLLTLLLPERYPKKDFVAMLLEKYRISLRPTHDEFGFNGIRFSCHTFNTEKEIDFAADILRKELTS